MISPVVGPPTTATLHAKQPLARRPSTGTHVWVLRAIWFLVFSIVALNAAVLICYANVYATNRTRGSILWVFRLFFLYANENAFLLDNSSFIAATYASLAAVYIFYAVRLMLSSLRKGRIRFGTAKVIPRRLRQLSSIGVLDDAAKAASKRFVKPVFHKLVQWQYDFGVHGRFFEVRLLLDEAVEVLTQTYSAYSASLSISNPPLNLCYAIVIFINSISTLIVRRFYSDSLVKQRIAWLVSDFVLDFVWGTAIPVWMSMSLYTTYTKFRITPGDFDATINSTREVERVIVLSWTNFLMSVVPFCNSFVSLAELVSVLKEPPASQPIASTVKDGNQRAAISRSRWMRVIHGLTACYGTGLLVTSLGAHGVFHKFERVDNYECLHRVHPWFSTKEACLGREINCSATNIAGSQSELDAVLELFDTVSLSDLIISDCPSMEFPSALSKYPRLQSISIQSSTVVAWDSTLAPTEALFPGLKTIYLSEIEIPNGLSGLVTHPLSPLIEWIGLVSIVDIKTVLTSVEGTGFWQNILYIDCEHSGLTNLPKVLYEMPRLLVISLVGNDIQSIPDNWTPPEQLQSLLLIGNANLESLPDALWRSVASTCELIVLSGTNLSTIPSWLPEVARSELVVNADDTPLCSHINENSLEIQQLVECKPHT